MNKKALLYYDVCFCKNNYSLRAFSQEDSPTGVTIREKMVVISRSKTVLILKGKAGEMVVTRVTAPRKGRAALVRVKREAKKENLKARMLVSGQT